MAPTGDNARGHLRLFVGRIEELNLDIDLLSSQKVTVYAEAKKIGLDVKALKSVLQARRYHPRKRDDIESMFTDYAAAVDKTALSSDSVAEDEKQPDPKTGEKAQPEPAEAPAPDTSLEDAIEKIGAMKQNQRPVMNGEAPAEEEPNEDQILSQIVCPDRVEAEADIDALFDGDKPVDTPEDDDDAPTPPVPHGPALSKTTFGSRDIDGVDDIEPAPKPEPVQENTGRKTKPAVNMDFPDGAVPDAFKETY